MNVKYTLKNNFYINGCNNINIWFIKSFLSLLKLLKMIYINKNIYIIVGFRNFSFIAY